MSLIRKPQGELDNMNTKIGRVWINVSLPYKLPLFVKSNKIRSQYFLGEEIPACLDEGSGIGISIEKGRKSSSWEECQRICNELPACSAWTFHEISPFSCDFFSKLESINAKNLSVTGQMNCRDPPSVMVINEGINKRNFNNGEDHCIMNGTKIRGVKLKKKRQEFNK